MFSIGPLIVSLIQRIHGQKDAFLAQTDDLLGRAGFIESRNLKLGFLFESFKQEVLEACKLGDFLDYFEVYQTYVADFERIFAEPSSMEETFRKSVAEFIDERLVSTIFYK